MKKKFMLPLFGILICLSGCGGIEHSVTEETKQFLPEKDEAVYESCVPTSGQEETNTIVPDRELVPINTTDEEIPVEWCGERLSRASACLGSTMYFSQWAGEDTNSALYEMNIGEASLQPSEIQIPEGMEIKAMAGDSKGHLHALIRPAAKASDKAYGLIRELDKEGNVIRDVDVSEAINGRYVLWQAFIVDSNGNYYIKDLDYLLCISKEGQPLWEMNNRSLEISRSYAMAAVDDSVYMTYQRNGVTYIGEINTADGSIGEEYVLPEITENDSVLIMDRGTDSDLLLYANNSGIWSWNHDGSMLENRANRSEAQLPYSEVIVARMFLRDGRLLLVKNVSDGDEMVGITFQYISGGK